MQISNENSGTFSLSFGAEFKNCFELQVVTDKGAVTVAPNAVSVLREDSMGKKGEKGLPFKPKDERTVLREMTAFGKAMSTGKLEQRATPEEAFVDLRVLQAMLESGEDRGMVKSV